jgi:hypothetical protein
MFGDGALTFQEFAMGESLPLSSIHEAVLQFLRGRNDTVLFGAQAVNAYVDEPRMTQDVDVLCPRAADFAEELRRFLNERFQIALPVRTVGQGSGYRIDQIRKPKNRHLVDVRRVDSLPPHQCLNDVQVLTPVALICHTLQSMITRSKTPKGMMDVADLRRLLLTFPELKVADGTVAAALRDGGARAAVMDAWRELVSQDIVHDDESY